MPSAPSVSPFASLGLRAELIAAITALGYEEPTPIQREAIPLLIDGADLLGQAETGTGKTAAFALPLVQAVGGTAAAPRKPGALVLVPTRELAMQVAEAIHKYGRGSGLVVLPLYGGAPMQAQIRSLERGAHIVVATPGRALDHMRRETLRLEAVRVLILDEADEMLDMGFAEDLDAILKATPETRQTALFSATMPKRILAIAERHLRTPEKVTIAREKPAVGSAPRVKQVAYVAHRQHKAATLARILDMEDPTATLVFCRTRLEVEALVDNVNAHGRRAEALHGGMAQRQRDLVMGRFRARKADLLIATDVAARGLDIEHVSHVVNYDVPASAEVYLHRIGRTGRAGREGVAITLAEPREHRLLRQIERVTRVKIDVATVPTVADLRARQLDLTRASLREELLSGTADDVRVVVESLAQEFDIVDIAAAAVKLAHAATTGKAPEQEIPPAAIPSLRSAFEGDSPRAGRGGGARRERHDEQDGGDDGRQMVRLFFGAGRRAGIRPADLVGAIAGEAGIPSRALGAIEIADTFSLVNVPGEMADRIIQAMRRTTLRGKKVQVRFDREGGGAPGRRPRNHRD